MKKQPVALCTVVLYGITAAIWLLYCFRDFSIKGQADGLRVLCAAVWLLNFFVQLRRYQAQK